jgi:DNA-binding SARP family transcriptional activator
MMDAARTSLLRSPDVHVAGLNVSVDRARVSDADMLAHGGPARVQTPAEHITLALLGTFDASVEGDRVALPMHAQRLVAFLALHNRWMLRSFVAGSLWLDSTDERAAGSLRSSLWRVNREAPLVETRGEQLRLQPGVVVDVEAAVEQAHGLLDLTNGECPKPNEVLLREDLLPDWYEDWVALERERLRLLRVHALEQLCERLIAGARYGEATEACLAAMRTEPLRESTQRLLIRIHLAQGNTNEALSRYQSFRAMLRKELGIDPTSQLTQLVAHLTVG